MDSTLLRKETSCPVRLFSLYGLDCYSEKYICFCDGEYVCYALLNKLM